MSRFHEIQEDREKREQRAGAIVVATVLLSITVAALVTPWLIPAVLAVGLLALVFLP